MKIFHPYIAFSLGLATLLTTSCSKENIDPDIPTPTPEVTASLQADSITVEVYEGHSHLKQGTEPEAGEVFWGTSNRGFHANPPTQYFPMRTYQKMVFRRAANGEMQMDRNFDTAFLIQSSPSKVGNWYGMVVKVYGDGGKRLDLEMKKEGDREHVQVFYTVQNAQGIAQTIPANVTTRDTTFTLNDLTDEDVVQELRAAGYEGKELTLNYHTARRWTPETKNEDTFYFWYLDRAEDSRTSPYLTTPVGFRGVFAARVPYVAYNVEMTITRTPEVKDGLRNSVSPSEMQQNHAILKLQLPFKNVFESIGWGEPMGDEKLISMVYEKEYKYYRDDYIDRLINTRAIYIPVLREFPQYTVEQLVKWFDLDSSLDIENSNFWL